MNRSKLMNHINHLKAEVTVLEGRRDIRAEMKKLDAILVYDTTIEVLKSRIRECEAQLKEDRHKEIE
tara:strand:+ start:501 stop:701 length:201 start_codon:yes stop_codon:yes gene_type:complete